MANPDHAAAVRALLTSTALSELLKNQHVITVKDSSSVDQTLRVLAAHRILSAPVVSTATEGREHPDSAEPSERTKDVAGFIDIRDILSSFLQEVGVGELKEAKMLKRMRILEEAGARFAGKCIKDLKSLGSDGWFYSLTAAPRTTLRDIIHDGFLHPTQNKATFGGTRQRPVVHRLALHDDDGQLTNIVSQSDVVKFLYEHIDELGPMADATVQELGFVTGTVITVRPDTPALDAMILMEARNISAVAVVAASGSIIANFSISELRTIVSEHFGSLSLPVGEFLALEHGTEYAGYAIMKEDTETIESTPAARFAHDRNLRRRESNPGYEVGQQLITCSPEATFAEVLDKLVHNRLHRVYVCSEGLVPTGVVTLTDILRKLVEA
ncbi:hypothetical protein N2152v2_002806 [Parachlorella kessleri]